MGQKQKVGIGKTSEYSSPCFIQVSTILLCNMIGLFHIIMLKHHRTYGYDKYSNKVVMMEVVTMSNTAVKNAL